MFRPLMLAAVAVFALAASPAAALSMKECSTKYSAAKADGSLGDLTWNQYRAQMCSTDAEPVMQPKAEIKPAKALSMKECSTKYKAAKDNGSLGGLNWNDFRSTKCGADEEDEPTQASLDNTTDEPAAPTMNAPASVLFPKVIAQKYLNEKPGKARMLTCVEAYRINKQRETLGGLKWIQKGGGYYSLCNARLKAVS